MIGKCAPSGANADIMQAGLDLVIPIPMLVHVVGKG